MHISCVEPNDRTIRDEVNTTISKMKKESVFVSGLDNKLTNAKPTKCRQIMGCLYYQNIVVILIDTSR